MRAREGWLRHVLYETRCLGFLLVAVLLASWEVAALLDVVYAAYFPRVSRIAVSFAELVASGELPHHVARTLARTFRGYAWGIAVGIGLGIGAGLWRAAHALLGLTIEIIRPMPVVAIIPIAILFLGMGDRVNTFVVALACTWTTDINTFQGVRRVGAELIDTGRIFGCHPPWNIPKIILPAAMPFIVSGLRVSLAIGLIVAAGGWYYAAHGLNLDIDFTAGTALDVDVPVSTEPGTPEKIMTEAEHTIAALAN